MMITSNVLISQRFHSSLRGLVLYRPYYMWTKFLSGQLQLLIMHANLNASNEHSALHVNNIPTMQFLTGISRNTQ